MISWKEVVSVRKNHVPNNLGGSIPSYIITYINDGVLSFLYLVSNKKTRYALNKLEDKNIIKIEHN